MRENVLNGETIKCRTGCGNCYVIVNVDKDGKPSEVFVNLGKAGGCAAAQTEALGRVITVALQAGASVERIIKQLSGISCHLTDVGTGTHSCADAISLALRTVTEAAEQCKPSDIYIHETTGV